MKNAPGKYSEFATKLESYVKSFIPSDEVFDDMDQDLIFDKRNIELIVRAYKNNFLEDELSYLSRDNKYFESLYVKEAIKDFFHKNEIFRLGYLD